jgi:hypothetical protein
VGRFAAGCTSRPELRRRGCGAPRHATLFPEFPCVCSEPVVVANHRFSLYGTWLKVTQGRARFSHNIDNRLSPVAREARQPHRAGSASRLSPSRRCRQRPKRRCEKRLPGAATHVPTIRNQINNERLPRQARDKQKNVIQTPKKRAFVLCSQAAGPDRHSGSHKDLGLLGLHMMAEASAGVSVGAPLPRLPEGKVNGYRFALQ